MLVIRLSFCDKLLIPYIEFFCSSCLLSPSTCIHKDLEPVSWLPKGFSSVGAFESKLIFFNSFSMWLSSSVFSKIVALRDEDDATFLQECFGQKRRSGLMQNIYKLLFAKAGYEWTISSTTSL